jgi:hypothetical protein
MGNLLSNGLFNIYPQPNDTPILAAEEGQNLIATLTDENQIS